MKNPTQPTYATKLTMSPVLVDRRSPHSMEWLHLQIAMILSELEKRDPHIMANVTVTWRQKRDHCDHCYEDLPEAQLTKTWWDEYCTLTTPVEEYWCAECRQRNAATIVAVVRRAKARKATAKGKRS